MHESDVYAKDEVEDGEVGEEAAAADAGVVAMDAGILRECAS